MDGGAFCETPAVCDCLFFPALSAIHHTDLPLILSSDNSDCAALVCGGVNFTAQILLQLRAWLLPCFGPLGMQHSLFPCEFTACHMMSHSLVHFLDNCWFWILQSVLQTHASLLSAFCHLVKWGHPMCNSWLRVVGRVRWLIRNCEVTYPSHVELPYCVWSSLRDFLFQLLIQQSMNAIHKLLSPLLWGLSGWCHFWYYIHDWCFSLWIHLLIGDPFIRRNPRLQLDHPQS